MNSPKNTNWEGSLQERRHLHVLLIMVMPWLILKLILHNSVTVSQLRLLSFEFHFYLDLQIIYQIGLADSLIAALALPHKIVCRFLDKKRKHKSGVLIL